MRKLALAVVALTIVASLARPSAPATAANPQFRAYWVDAFGPGLNDAGQIDAVVAATKAANMNAIVAQVVRRGDCWCNRAAVPRTDAGIAAFPFDPLDTLIQKAHAQGIEVHAWVIATAMWRGSTPPSQPDHVFNLHGPAASGADNWLTKRADGLTQLNEDWVLDPGHPDAAAWVARVATSIVANYDVDGINLDRIRYPDGNLGSLVPSWGYNPVAVARFQQATGRTDVPAPADQQWAQWRRDQVTAIVRKVYVESYALKRGVRVSADTITYGSGPQSTGSWETTRAYAEQLQDWRSWMREGILDLNITMNYKRDAQNSEPSNQRRWYAEWSDFAKDNQYHRQALVGSALYLNDIAASVRQVRTALVPSGSGNSGAGWAGYSYRTPDALTDAGTRSGDVERAELTRALTQTSSYDPVTPPVFADAAAVPAMVWKAQPTVGQIRGTARAPDGGALAQQPVFLYLADTNTLLRTATTDGTGWFAFIDVFPVRYRVDSPLAPGGTLGYVDAIAGAVTSPAPAGAPSPSPTPPGATPTPPPAPTPTPPPGSCASSTGPGIAPPAKIPAGIPGFHAAWYGQSGYPTLCPGAESTAVVAYYNSGARGWVLGRMGEVAYLGTWQPEPGQDRASALGGDGTVGSPNTGWPRYNRIAIQPAAYVGPGQVAWFQFTIKAPATPGTYRLYLRPLIEGATWLEDYGVFWVVTVRN